MNTSDETGNKEFIKWIAALDDSDSENNSTYCSVAETKSSLKEAENHMNNVIRILENTPRFDLGDTMLAHRLRNLIMNHKLLKESIQKILGEIKEVIEISAEKYLIVVKISRAPGLR